MSPMREIETLHQKIVRETAYRLGVTEDDGPIWRDKCEEIGVILRESYRAQREARTEMSPWIDGMCRKEIRGLLADGEVIHLHELLADLSIYPLEVASRAFTDLLARGYITLDAKRDVRLAAPICYEGGR